MNRPLVERGTIFSPNRETVHRLLFHGSATPLLVKSFSFFYYEATVATRYISQRSKHYIFLIARLACVASGVFWCVFSSVVFEVRDTDARKLNRGNALKQTLPTQTRAHLNFQFKVQVPCILE